MYRRVILLAIAGSAAAFMPSAFVGGSAAPAKATSGMMYICIRFWFANTKPRQILVCKHEATTGRRPVIAKLAASGHCQTGTPISVC
jgi:hypothetical protein